MANGVVTDYTGEGGDINIPAVDGDGKAITTIGDTAPWDYSGFDADRIAIIDEEQGKEARS